MKKVIIFNCNSISEKWDPRLGTFGETRDPRTGTHLTGGTWDLRPGTLKVRPKIRGPDPTLTWDPVLDYRDPIGGTQGPRHGTLNVDFLKIVSVFSDAPRL